MLYIIKENLMPSSGDMDTPLGYLIGDSQEAIASRCRWLAAQSGYASSRAFAIQFLGISAQRWHYAEKGNLSNQIAQMLIRRLSGVTWDWLREGKGPPPQVIPGNLTTVSAKPAKRVS